MFAVKRYIDADDLLMQLRIITLIGASNEARGDVFEALSDYINSMPSHVAFDANHLEKHLQLDGWACVNGSRTDYGEGYIQALRDVLEHHKSNNKEIPNSSNKPNTAKLDEMIEEDGWVFQDILKEISRLIREG